MRTFTTLIALLSVLLTTPAWAAPASPAEAQQHVIKNLLPNPGFEASKAGWAASSAPTFTIVNATANVGSGTYAAAFDPSAASQTLVSNAVAIPSGLYGRNGYASCLIKTASTDAKIQAYDGTNVLAEQTVTGISAFAKEGVNFIFPTSGNIQLRVISASDSAVMYLDDCFLGEASNVGFVSPITSQQAITLTPSAGFGTSTLGSYWYVRVGDTMRVKGYFKAGTVAASTAYITLPSGYAVASGKMTSTTSVQAVGQWHQINSGAAGDAGSYPMFYDGSDTTNLYFAFQGGSNVLVKATGSGLVPSNSGISFEFSIPIQGWTSESAIKIDETGQSWSGYHANNCAWSRTNTSYGDPAADASCTFTERTNRNFGTVTSSGSTLPNIVFTPKKSGRYYVCANTNAVASGTDTYGLKLWDGTTTIAENTGNGTAQMMHPLCGIYNAASTSAVTLSVQIRSVSAAITIGPQGTGGGASAIEWTIFSLDQLNSPILTNILSTSSSTGERSESAYFGGAGSSSAPTACSSTPCTIYRQSGSWLTSVTRSATGTYTLNIASGMFSDVPSCHLDPIAKVSYQKCQINGTTPSKTSQQFTCRNTAGAENDDAVFVTCQGPR